MARTRKRRGPMADINVVPYIDVMLVLLVIFMITAPLLSEGVTVKLPKAAARPMPAATTPVIVSVDAGGRYYLNTAQTPSQPIAPEALVTQVSQALQQAAGQHQTQDVYVKGDQAANYGQVVAVMALLQQAGVENIGLITESPAPSS